MKCSNCSAENGDVEFCTQCGAPLTGSTDEAVKDTDETALQEDAVNAAAPDLSGEPAHDDTTEADEAEYDGEEPQPSAEAEEAMDKLKKYEEGTITHPYDKPKAKRKFYCPKNPVLWSFLWLLAFGVILGGLTVLFFNIDLDGAEILFGTVFAAFTVLVLAIDFIYYFPAALTLDRLFKGKGVNLQYKLNDYELVDLAEEAKKRNRGFYLVIGLFGLAFTVYYIIILSTAVMQTTLMWVSLIFSICVFLIFAALFFIMPKFNYDRMMQGGNKVIIGERSVFYGGNYYHWRKIQPEATFGSMNTKKHQLQINFTQEYKNGSTKRRKVEVFVPDRELRGVTCLLEKYEAGYRKYQEKQLKNSILNETEEAKKK